MRGLYNERPEEARIPNGGDPPSPMSIPIT